MVIQFRRKKEEGQEEEVKPGHDSQRAVVIQFSVESPVEQRVSEEEKDDEGIMAGDLAMGAGPGVQVQQQQEEENSDLEVWTSSPPSLPRSPGTPEI